MKGALAEITGLIGLAMILIPSAYWDSSTLFPGRSALIPCLGAAFVIVAGLNGPCLIGNILSSMPLTHLGLISYSLYLWHWPIISFCHHLFLDLSRPVVAFVLVILISVFSLASYHFVEKPVRRLSSSLSLRQVVAGFSGLSLTTLMFGLILDRFAGFPHRFSPESLALLGTHEETYSPLYDTDKIDRDQTIVLYRAEQDHRPEVLVYGDSHAQMLFPVFADLGKQHNINVNALFARGTVPFPDAWQVGSGIGGIHKRPFKTAVRNYVGRNRPEVVVVSCRWNSYVSDPEYFIVDESAKEINQETSREVFRTHLTNMIREFESAGSKVVLIGPVPEPGFDVPRAMARTSKLKFVPMPRTSLSTFNEPRDFLQGVFSGLDSSVLVVDLNPLLVDQDKFILTSVSSQPVYYDDDHLSTIGAMHSMPALEQIFFLPELIRKSSDDVRAQNESATKTGDQ